METSEPLMGKGPCVDCGKPFTWGVNVLTELGRRETFITGMCETCFDELTLEAEKAAEEGDPDAPAF